jgi:metal-dependent amidase/aminoacylase/carboxypeptidase family protein
VPGSFLSVGARNEERGMIYPHHHPRFAIDEDALENGVRMFVCVTFGLLGVGTRASA